MEEKVAVEGNHSTMVKFSSQNANYNSVLGALRKFEKEAKVVVEGHFGPGTGT